MDLKMFKLKRDEEKDFTTFPRTFERYRWYKSILIFISSIFVYIGLLMVTRSVANLLIPGFNPSGVIGEIYTLEGIYPLIQLVLMVPALYIPVRLIYKVSFSNTVSAFRKWNWIFYIKAALVAFTVFLTYQTLDMVINGYTFVNHFSVVTLLLILIITPLQSFAEEYTDRGFLMQTLGSWFRIPILAIVLQSILFTALHGYNLIGLVDVFLVGCVFGFLTWYTRGLEVSSAIHMSNNLTNFLNVGFGLTTASLTVGLIDVVLGIGLMAVIIAVIFVLEWKFSWFGFNEDENFFI